MTEFLAEFEQRLLEHPEEAATSALQVVEDRAEGRRRQASPGAGGRATVTTDPMPASAAAATPAPIASPAPASVAEPGAGALPTAGEAPPETEAAPAAGEVAEPGESAETVAQSRGLRGRRRRRHRHRAH